MGEPLIKEFSGVLYPKDKEIADYRYISFTLPEGYSSIEIEYSFEKEKKCVIDIGVFDSQNRFRGWSGSSKSRIYIDTTSATPGYIAGEMPPGTWTVVLGLARVSDDGCRYRIVVKMYRSAGKYLNEECSYKCSEKPLHVLGSRWVKGDLHVHSIHSDGKDSVCSLVSKAVKLGLDYIAITDHNTISQLFEIEALNCREVLVIPGIEISTYYGHINTWGRRWFDFRRRSIDDFRSLVNEMQREGFIISVNHPFNFDENCIGCDFRYKDLAGFNSIEVWNGPTPLNWNMQSVVWWHNMLSSGLRIPAVGGSDYHGGDGVELATPTTWVYVNTLSIEGVLLGIVKGRVFISRGPRGPILNTMVYYNNRLYSMGDELSYDGSRKGAKIIIDVEVGEELLKDGVILRLLSSKGVLRVFHISGKLSRFIETVGMDRGDRFIRAEIGCYADPYSLDPNSVTELLALGNPIYIS